MQLVGGTYTAGKSVCGTNCPEVILFRNTTASNVMLVADAGRAKIVYNPTFITSIYDRYGDAGVQAIMAHEIGHALDDALGAVWIEKSWTPELRADSWAGCILAKSNLSPADVTAALAALAGASVARSPRVECSATRDPRRLFALRRRGENSLATTGRLRTRKGPRYW